MGAVKLLTFLTVFERGGARTHVRDMRDVSYCDLRTVSMCYGLFIFCVSRIFRAGEGRKIFEGKKRFIILNFTFRDLQFSLNGSFRQVLIFYNMRGDLNY